MMKKKLRGSVTQWVEDDEENLLDVYAHHNWLGMLHLILQVSHYKCLIAALQFINR